MAYKRSSFSQRKINSWFLYSCVTALNIRVIYICLVLWKKNPKQIHQHGPKIRSGIFEFIKLNRSSRCRVNLDRCHLSSYLLSFNKTAFLHLFFGLIFMSLIQPLVVYQTQLRSTQFKSKVCFDKRLANYI